MEIPDLSRGFSVFAEKKVSDNIRKSLDKFREMGYDSYVISGG